VEGGGVVLRPWILFTIEFLKQYKWFTLRLSWKLSDEQHSWCEMLLPFLYYATGDTWNSKTNRAGYLGDRACDSVKAFNCTVCTGYRWQPSRLLSSNPVQHSLADWWCHTGKELPNVILHYFIPWRRQKYMSRWCALWRHLGDNNSMQSEHVRYVNKYLLCLARYCRIL